MPAIVDLRSDTVTRPTEAMRKAMAEAEVGDDVYAEDPTINALEEEVAGLFGHAAAVFVPTGTMGNQIALRMLCTHGEELLCDADAHVVSYEGGGLAAQGGIQTRTMVVPRGLLSPEVVKPQIRVAGFHAVPTVALEVEQTHNRGGGAVYPLSLLRELRGLVDQYGLAFHCDGARVWNAHVASGVSLSEYGVLFDTMSVCLSKGLGAPVGSVVLMKDADRVEEARELRHRLGGAMRQAGIIAAGGRYALAHHIERLAEDHERAKRLAVAIADVAPDAVDPGTVETNMVMLDVTGSGIDAVTLDAVCREEGVLISTMAPHWVRLVTHLDVDDAAIDRAIAVIRSALAS
ncbi:MAG TPA: GntG family PLP-dependent aldolase [Mycobacteriales bacterium]|nr:GntG family PLP-dependent aldolase [Mycobacteriales bacterium]